MKCNPTRANSGFSLIEMMVSTAIFTVVCVVAIGAVFTINDANRKAQAIRAVVDNLNLSLESMSRKMMTGNEYECGGGKDLPVGPYDRPQLFSCPDESNIPDISSISFISSEQLTGSSMGVAASQAGAVVIYKLKSRGSCNVGQNGCVGNLSCADSKELNCRGKIVSSWRTGTGSAESYTEVDVTPPEVNIRDLRFYVRGVPSGEQPRVTMVISGEIDLVKENLRTPFNLQTTVSQRKPR